MKTFSLILTWDNFPEGGTYGTVVKAEDETQAEELARQEMAALRSEAHVDDETTHEEAAQSVRDSYEHEWIVVESREGDMWADPEVWLVLIDHSHGSDAEVYATEAAAKAGLYGFVAEYWGELWDDEDEESQPLPEDHDEAIRLYFDNHDRDAAQIRKAPVQS